MTTANTGTEIVLRREAEDFMPVMGIDQAITRYNAVIDFTRKVMVKGRDYGVIPGTEKKKREGDLPSSSENTLLKPGAEKLCTLFGLSPRFEDYRVTEDWANGLFYYAYRCVLSRNGRTIAEGIGSANSREKKYRRETRLCPACEKPTISKSKYPPKSGPRNAPGGWWCNPKAGGCGAEFAHDDPAVLDQAVTIDANAAADQVNTLQKMAQKRSLVAATLIATNASEFFTQDVDDVETPAGRGAEPDVVDGEVVGEANEFDAFLIAWDEATAKHRVEESIGRSILNMRCVKHKVVDRDFYKSTPEQRTTMLNEYMAMAPAQISQLVTMLQKKPPAQPAPTTLPPLDATSCTDDLFVMSCIEHGEHHKHTEPEVFASVNAAIEKRGGLASVTAADRLTWLTAFATNTWDYQKNTPRPAKKNAA